MDDSEKNIEQLLRENRLLKTQLAELKDLARQYKITEDALKSSTERLKIIFDSAPDAIFLIDTNAIFIEINDLFEKIIGKSKGDIIGKSVFEMDLVAEGEVQKISRAMELNLQGNKFGPEEILVKNVHGDLIYSEISSYPITIKNKIIILGVARDISERKKAEEISKENDQRLSLHFNQTPLGVIEWDLDFNVKKWNAAAERIFGYSEKEAIGNYASFIVPSYHAKGMKSLMSDLVSLRGGKRSTSKNIKKSGETILCEWYNTPLVNAKGKVIAIASLVQDISDRVRNNKIQKVLYDISNAVNTTDNLHKLIGIIQNNLGRIIDTTNFFIALYNENDDTLSLPFFVDEKDVFTAIPAKKTLTKYVVKTNKPLLADAQLMRKLEKQGEIESVGTDSKVWLGVPLITEGKITGVLAVQSYDDENAFNLTDVQMLEFVSDQISISINRKKTDDELIEALNKAEESDRLKTAFLQNMSHEIRTPMNGILGFTALLKEPDLNVDEQKEYLQIIEKSGERMLNTINDLMDISKVEAGQMGVVISEIKLNEQVDYQFSFFQSEAEKKGLKLYCEKGLPDTEAVLFSDKEKLCDILTNLIKNAIKYTEKGSVTFGYKNKKDECIEFFVKDTGIGISRKKLETVFDRFVQVHQDLTSKYEGTGLGLSITKAYVELLGGKIGAKSEYGKGSIFYFEIPKKVGSIVEKKQEIIETDIEQKDDKKSQIKILIAEDDTTIRTYLSIAIRKITKNILFAKNGLETVEICRNNPDIDLILMDIKMPGIDGYEATRIIREFNTDVIIVAQTAFDFASEKDKIEAAGCNDYLSKPVKRDALIKLIEKYFKS